MNKKEKAVVNEEKLQIYSGIIANNPLSIEGIPYNWQHKFEEVVDNVVDKAIDKLSKTERKIYDEIVKHPHSSQPEIAIKCGVGKTTVQNVIKKLKEDKIIRRKDSNKTGY